ncbi:hypothetical protein IFM89_036696 [Coptis chinensis]|uniref:Uncharacterized protein n=1 Tax=Coptis chinensis TaxID=261450 RepID=A0A835I8H0_9MAGN|nr:hypothetical protein IFM89_036696 [Coptis chinensis]
MYVFENIDTIDTDWTISKFQKAWKEYKHELFKKYVKDQPLSFVREHSKQGIPLQDWRQFVDNCNFEKFKVVNEYIGKECDLRGGWPLRVVARGIVQDIDPNTEFGNRRLEEGNFKVHVNVVYDGGAVLPLPHDDWRSKLGEGNMELLYVLHGQKGGVTHVYVGGIPHDASGKDLKGFCESVGEVTKQVASDSSYSASSSVGKKLRDPSLISGHQIELLSESEHCPTNGDPIYDKRGVRNPTGISSGEVDVFKSNETAFDRVVEGLSASSRYKHQCKENSLASMPENFSEISAIVVRTMGEVRRPTWESGYGALSSFRCCIKALVFRDKELLVDSVTSSVLTVGAFYGEKSFIKRVGNLLALTLIILLGVDGCPT